MSTQSGFKAHCLKRKRQLASEREGEERNNNKHVLSQAPTAMPANCNGRKVNFILDNAAIKKISIKKKWKIPRSLDDAEIILSQKKVVDDYRCDIVHEALRAILDSPLNKSGLVGSIYVKIQDGVLFEVRPEVRIPRTLDRFCSLMGNLLEKSCIRSQETHEILLRVNEEPVIRYLPVNGPVIVLSHTSKKLVNIEDYVSAASDETDFTFVVGTSAKGEISKQYVNDLIAVTNYPLCAKGQVGMICHALEQKWNVF